MLEDMVKKIEDIVTDNFKDYQLKIPYQKSYLIDYLYKKAIIKSRNNNYENIELEISCKKEDYNKILSKIDSK